jgi:hypothetical protein
MNPIKSIRENDLRLKFTQFCTMTDTSSSAVYFVEAGAAARIPKKILSYLISRGYNKETLIRDYSNYREHLKASLTKVTAL